MCVESFSIIVSSRAIIASSIVGTPSLTASWPRVPRVLARPTKRVPAFVRLPEGVKVGAWSAGWEGQAELGHGLQHALHPKIAKIVKGCLLHCVRITEQVGDVQHSFRQAKSVDRLTDAGRASCRQTHSSSGSHAGSSIRPWQLQQAKPASSLHRSALAGADNGYSGTASQPQQHPYLRQLQQTCTSMPGWQSAASPSFKPDSPVTNQQVVKFTKLNHLTAAAGSITLVSSAVEALRAFPVRGCAVREQQSAVPTKRLVPLNADPHVPQCPLQAESSLLPQEAHQLLLRHLGQVLQPARQPKPANNSHTHTYVHTHAITISTSSARHR
jgi:hypothetical protein